ncbi:hypothetical protein LIER_36411 [Lithospermum erythrorhizon]|uniref:Bifunctional inhibitor/plant lipid transfer protein/seed storage helical domain-containing protein n=1 Tax=Lithospermum erythrorhizon TaxID=34254 RepID=A0AAV3P5G4_LITER
MNQPALNLIVCTMLIFLAMPILVYGQITTLCTASLLQSFAPCTDFASKLGGSSPTEDCCTSLKYLMGNGTDCLCLIATGGVPFKAPINRDLTMSLPKACKMSGVPIECKERGGAPLPAPGPDGSDSPLIPGGTLLSPPPVGTFVPGLTPDGGLTPPGLTPDGGFTPPGLNPNNGGFPGLTPPDSDLTPPFSTPPGTRPTLSASTPSQMFSITLLLVAFAASALNYL